ncbi:MAG: mechanosensitive ion channel [Labilithrix sp.]|nr:mechanosensitive ion channel [Labilithrix sp.]MCW5812843.1 mechanosensitive ion channel [Labilithrix sp.]
MMISRHLRRRAGVVSAFVLSILCAPLPAAAQDAPDVGALAKFVRWGGVAVSLLIIVGALVALRIVTNLATRLGTRFANRRPTIQKVESATRFGIYMVTLAVCVGLSVRLDPTAIAVIGGALAFAVGFAMRDLVAAFIAGITIMFDRPFQVGDRVAYAGQYGDIISIGLRSVQMNTLDDHIITIPNNKILTDVTSSANYGALEMQVGMDFYIRVDQDAKLAAALIREACLTSPYVFLAQPVPVLMKPIVLNDHVVLHLKARPYVFDCKFEKPFESDVHFRVLDAFRAHGIALPRGSADLVGPIAT